MLRRDEREKGQTSLVLLAFISFLLVGAGLIARYAGSDDVGSQARTAADAAALAGADRVVDQLVAQLASDEPIFNVACAVGRDDASLYAQRNDARLTHYCFDLATGTATAEVIYDRPSGGVVAETASARLRAIPHCTERPVPTPTPTPPSDDEDEDEEETEPEPPPEPIWDCRLTGIDGVFDPADGFDPGAIRRLMKPRLVG